MTEPLAAQMRAKAAAFRQRSSTAMFNRMGEDGAYDSAAAVLDAFADAADRAAAEASAREAAYAAALERIGQLYREADEPVIAPRTAGRMWHVAAEALTAAPERARALAGLVERANALIKRADAFDYSDKECPPDGHALDTYAWGLLRELRTLGMEVGDDE